VPELWTLGVSSITIYEKQYNGWRDDGVGWNLWGVICLFLATEAWSISKDAALGV
jgi:hypothetical protein